VVVIQEAFGITAYLERVCQQFADAGWEAVAPHLFHRTGDPVFGYDEYGKLGEHMAALTVEGITEDVDDALAALDEAGFPPGRCGIAGFCMGGAVALAMGVTHHLGAAVSFYGGGVAQGRFGFPPLLELASSLRTPWLGLYGDQDAGIPVEQAEALREAAAKAPVATELVIYPGAEHGFHCRDRGSYQEAAAVDGWRRTLAWFDAQVGGG
jgi:carboxymethylenebutenolidase